MVFKAFIILKFTFLLSLCFQTNFLNAQDTTQSKQDTTYYRYCVLEQFENFSEPIFSAIDTSLNLFQRYEPLSSCAFLGNSGKAYNNLLFETRFNPGFNLGEHVYRQYFPDREELFYYDVSSPFTDLYYVMGGSKEQILKVLHTQNINKLFNVALNFNIISSPGTYRRQKTDISNFIINTNYRSKNKRYTLLGNIMAYKWYNNENGGLYDVSDFTTQLLTRTDLFDVKLSSAQNRVKENSVFLRQEIGFNKTHTTDSLISPEKSNFNTKLSHTLKYNINSFMYIDENPSATYYNKIYFDTVYTGDSTHANILSNELALSQIFFRNKLKEAVLYADIALEHQYTDHRQFITSMLDSLIAVKKEKSYISQYIAKAQVQIKPALGFNINLNVYQIINGYNKDDIGFGFLSAYQVNDKHRISLKGTLNTYECPYHMSQFTSNHYIWQNNFKKTTQFDAGILYAYNDLKAGIEVQQLTDMVYMDYNAEPRQYSNSLQLIRFSLSKIFKWKSFYLYNSIYLQYTSRPLIYPLPLIVNNHSFFWSTHLFKKALYAQTGIDVYYNSSFKGAAYMPAIRQFYLQDAVLTGNYPFFDIFVNLRIKRANIFAKLTHLNQGFMGYTYYNVPDYPLQGRAFKLGVSWKFYD